MACKNAKFDAEDCSFICDITGDRCIYLLPNEKKCIEEGYLDQSE